MQETFVINLALETGDLDERLDKLTEKTKQLKSLLQEVKELLRSMNAQ